MTLNGVMAVILRYFGEFGYFPGVLRKSSRSLSHLLRSSCSTYCYYTTTATRLLLFLLLLYLTSDENGFVAELFAVVSNPPVRVDVDLTCFVRDGRINPQRGRDDGLRRRLGRLLQVASVPAIREKVVVVVVETLDEVHRLRVGVGDDARLRARVSHYVPSVITLQPLRSSPQSCARDVLGLMNPDSAL